MTILNLLLVPLAITAIVLGPHYFFKWWIQRKQNKKDDQNHLWWKELEEKTILDRKLSDDPGCENEEVLNPKYWEVNICCPN